VIRGPLDPARFARDGFAGPIRVLGPEQCRALMRYLAGTRRISPPVWSKSRAASDGLLARIASDSALTASLTALLGEDIILWGASFTRKVAGEVHPWHSDIESSRPQGGFVSAWIGLHNTTPRSSMRFVAGSHLTGKTIQQLRAEDDVPRSKVTDETVIEWARRDNPDARLVEVPANDGDMILFDGRIWHGSINRLESGERHSLLLQFASADTPVRIPDLANLRWPFKFLDRPRPPVVSVHGSARPEVNEVVSMPPSGPPRRQPAIPSAIRTLTEGRLGDDQDWQPFPIFRGRTAALDMLSCHSAKLRPGFTPHPPHAHQDEELLIVLEGEAQLLVAEGPEFAGAQSIPVKAGDFAYYPPFQHHTIRSLGDRPVHYLMFRWNRAEAEPWGGKLPAGVVRGPLPAEAKDGRGFSIRTLFEGHTHWLRKFHCHTTRLEPGAGYAPHADAYDVAMLMQSGRVQTLDGEAGPGQLIFYSAGELHGIRNVGDEPAHYLVFEWHGAPVALAAPGAAPAPHLALA
jgi:mannose-6-phosphate isomerase-like protein (cupin superfamily)